MSTIDDEAEEPMPAPGGGERREPGAAPEPKPDRPALERIGAEQFFADAPPVPWLVEALQIVAGRPCVLAAPGGAGKTIVAQSIALHVVTGRRLWGQYQVRRGRVLHLDYDQGKRATLGRYRKLATAMRATLDELAGRIEVVARPPLYLVSNGVEDALARETEGVDLCVLDAFRGAAPGLDENDSRAREPLDMLARVSERTGVAFLMLHHSGKPKKDEPEGKSPLRGSSALDDAAGVVIAIEGARGAPKRLRITRDSQDFDGGPPLDPFFLCFGGGAGELVLTYRTAEQVKPPRAPGAAHDELCAEVLEYVRRNPGAPGKASVAAKLAKRPAAVGLAIDELLDRGAIVDRREKNRPRFYSSQGANDA